MHRSRLPLGLAVVAVVASLVGAVGPAGESRTIYAWPPAALPDETPRRLWYTPLLLARHRPEAISATVPCSLPPPLPDAAAPATVLATARSPETRDGLSVMHGSGHLAIAVGARVLGRVPLAQSDDPACAYRLRLDPGTWSVASSSGVGRGGDLESMPIVTGIFSELDLRSPSPLTIEVTTAVHDSRPTLAQKAAWTIAALAVLAALVLVAVGRAPGRSWDVVRSAVRSSASRAHPADALVAVVLLAWWVLAPSYWDDGWIGARQASFSDSGGFSTYYDVLGANNPLGYWLDWSQRQFLLLSDDLLVLRLPALLCLAATWGLCRWILDRASHAARGVVLWTLTSAFLLGTLAWGMTVRPEFALALLVTAVLACAVRFLEADTVAPLAICAVLVPLALTAHPAGLLSIAPLLVIGPRLVRWARPRLAIAATVVVASGAVLTSLLFVGSDIGQRQEDGRIFEAFGTSGISWRDEALRYARLVEFPYATPIRRGWVALALLAAFAYLTRRRGGPRAALEVSGPALVLGLALLIATPSKWPWHFGALIGVAALAVAIEAARFRERAASSRGWQGRPFAVVAAVMVAAAWSWSPRSAWALLDLRALDWTPSFESRVSLSKLAFVLPLTLLAAVGLVEIVRRGRARLPDVPWRVAAWSGAVLSIPALVFTVAVLVVDNVEADGWTLARQNLGTLTGDSGCGVADDVLVAVPESLRPLAAADGSAPGGSRADASTIAPAAHVPFFALADDESTPWFETRPQGRFGLFVAGAQTPSARLGLEWGRRRNARVEVLFAGEVPTHFASAQTPGLTPWGFVAASELPESMAGGELVRVVLRSDGGPAGQIAVSAPVTYENEALARRLGRSALPVFVAPDLLPYFPCVRQPRLRAGVVEVPMLLVAPHDSTSWLETWTASPFRGLLDLYPLERLSVRDSKRPPRDLAVFGVDRRIPGAVAAAPTRTP